MPISTGCTWMEKGSVQMLLSCYELLYTLRRVSASWALLSSDDLFLVSPETAKFDKITASASGAVTIHPCYEL